LEVGRRGAVATLGEGATLDGDPLRDKLYVGTGEE
jgi:hypothetical protein